MRRIAILCLLLPLLGCTIEEQLQISGELTFQGVAVPGEITFEPLDSTGKATGRATSISVPQNGLFQARLPANGEQPLPFRLTVRVAPPAASREPAATINSNAFGAGVKTVPLLRELKDGQKLVLAITQ